MLERGWLSEREFLDAVAVAIITPGPVVITTAFIGYLVAGVAGAVVAAVGTFLPCYLVAVIPAPYFHRYGRRPALAAVVEAPLAGASHRRRGGGDRVGFAQSLNRVKGGEVFMPRGARPVVPTEPFLASVSRRSRRPTR